MNLTSGQTALFTLLRSGLWERKPDDLSSFPLSEKAWEDVYRMSVRQTVAGIVYRGLLQLPESLLPGDGLMVRWVGMADLIERRNIKMNAVLGELLRLMRGNGLHPVLLKGLGVAEYYEYPLLRECGDIDLYFTSKKEKLEADELMRGAGCRVQKESDGSSCYSWHGVTIEHHDRMFDLYSPLMKRYLAALVSEHGFSTMTLNAAEGNVPTVAECKVPVEAKSDSSTVAKGNFPAAMQGNDPLEAEQRPAEAQPCEAEHRPAESQPCEAEQQPAEAQPCEAEQRPAESQPCEAEQRPAGTEGGNPAAEGNFPAAMQGNDPLEAEQRPAEAQPCEAEDKVPAVENIASAVTESKAAKNGQTAAQDNAGAVTVPAALLTLLMMNAHLLKHMMGHGVGLRQFCDMARAYHTLHGKYSAEELETAYKHCGLLKWSVQLHTLMTEYLGLNYHELPYVDTVQSTSPQVLRIVLDGGNFGQYNGANDGSDGHGSQIINATGSAAKGNSTATGTGKDNSTAGTLTGGRTMQTGWRRKVQTIRIIWGRRSFSRTYAPKEAFWMTARLIIGNLKR